MNDLDVKEIRTSLGLTQQEFANRLGVSRNTILNYEKGETIPASKSIILHTMLEESQIGDVNTSFKKEKVNKREIPLIPIDALAGFGSGEFTIMQHDIIEYYKVPEFSNADFLITVKGSSMQPKYYGGDILACKFINSWSFFQWGIPHVITLKDRGTVVKRMNKGKNNNEFILVSDNENYQAFTITIDDLLNIALVVGVIRVEN